MKLIYLSSTFPFSTVKHVSKLEQQNLQGNNDKHLLKVQDFFQKLYHSNKYNSKDVMKECYGFCLTKERSNIEGGGYGVFVDSGHVSRFSLVAFYPGKWIPYTKHKKQLCLKKCLKIILML